MNCLKTFLSMDFLLKTPGFLAFECIVHWWCMVLNIAVDNKNSIVRMAPWLKRDRVSIARIVLPVMETILKG
jgi:hypothetical protein